MQLIDLLTPDRVLADVLVSSKKRALEFIADLIAKDDGAGMQRLVLDGFCARERMGTTAFGGGVAMPHGRLKNFSEARGAFVRLNEPVDFHAADGQPVDLIFALAVPDHFTDQHLILLAQIAEMFTDRELTARLRQVRDSAALYDLLASWNEAKPHAA
jgi:nitrogen PTS system EIIA component